jgi:4'-phosphopantetheinyl transferase
MPTVPSAGSVDVWWLDITSVSVGRAELAELSLEEHKRAAAFAFRADRRRYTAAHVMLRRVLSGYLDFPPSSLIFHREPCPRCGKPTGRPALELRYGVHFSLAHSGDAVLVAVASQQGGVDVEQQPTGCVCSMSADMNATDAEWGRSLSEAGRHDLVIRWWVRSEAVLKCTGEGIGHEVGEFPVLGRPGRPGSAGAGHPGARLLADLAPGPGRLPGRARTGREYPGHPAQRPGALGARRAPCHPGCPGPLIPWTARRRGCH